MVQEQRQTRRARYAKQRNKWLPWLIGLLAIFILAGGFWLNRDRDHSTPEQTDFTEEIKNYFKPSGTVATFQIDGNMFTEKTTWLNDQYVQLFIESNEGNRQEIYRINKNTIDLVYSSLYLEQANRFTDAELNEFETIDTILQWPLDSKRFGAKHMAYPVAFETSFLEFSNAVRVERNDGSGKTYNYYAEGYGFIGREIVKDGKPYYQIKLNKVTN